MHESGFFRLSSQAEFLLRDLALPSGEGLLVVASAEPPHSLRNDECDIVLATGSLRDQVNSIQKNGPFDGAIIIPPFATEVDAQILEQPTGWGSLRRWYVEEYLIAHAWSQLKDGGWIVALVSNGLLSANQRKDARRELLHHSLRLVSSMPRETLWDSPHEVDAYLIIAQRNSASYDSIIMLDLDSLLELPSVAVFKSWLEGKVHIATDINPVVLALSNIKGDMRIDPAHYDPSYLALQAPSGLADKQLGEIAEIIGGFRVDGTERSTERLSPNSFRYLQVRHLSVRGEIEEQTYWVERDHVEPHLAKRAMPGDILVSVSGTIGKVALVGPDYRDGLLFDTSIRRLRMKTDSISPIAVADFLRSELGQLQFQRMTLGSVIPYLPSRQLAQFRIFLHKQITQGAQGDSTKPPAVLAEKQSQALSPEQIYKKALEGELDVILRQIRDANHSDWRQTVAEKLRRLANDLAPKQSSERVRQDYPAPLAIAYRRYQMAKHNPYEQLDRMISLVEACTYFVFHVLLADYSQAEWRNKYELPKPAASALKSRASFENRIQFIRAITELAKKDRLDLFVPNLLDCNIDRYVDDFRKNLRNPVAHSSPGSESYVAALVQKYHDQLHEMLDRMSFLANYTMCRIRSHYFQHGRWHYQCELYRGEEYDVNLQETPLRDEELNGRLIKADRNHLVLMSPDYEVLDLWPYYQLHFSDVTCRETHLCFVKHIGVEDRQLYGESIRSGIEIELVGFDEYFRASIGSKKPA